MLSLFWRHRIIISNIAINAKLYANGALRFAQNAIDSQNHAMEIGHVIRALRKKRGESLEKVAFEAGTDASNLSRIERCIQQPSPELLRAIAASLQTTVATLHAFTEGKSDPPNAPREALGIDELDFCDAAVQLRNQFRELTPENQKIAVELLRALNRTQKHK